MIRARRSSKEQSPEENRHVKLLRVRFTAEVDPYRQAKIVAGQLRVLAVNTDGRAAVAGAFEAELVDRGMRFRFTSALKRDEFKGRILNYLSTSVTKRLTYSV